MKPSKKALAKRKEMSLKDISFYKEIWEERPHVCEITGAKIEFSPIVFSHILSKGAYPEYRYKKENIMLVTARIHQIWEFEGDILTKEPRLQKKIDKAKELKQLYYKEHGFFI